MKLLNWGCVTLMGCALAFAGCGKSTPSVNSDGSAQVLDATKFASAFESSSTEIKAEANHIMISIQGSTYKDALAGLEKLAARPDVSEAQKKVVDDLLGQLKKKMADMAH